MRVTLRWFGPEDPVSLAAIRQIPAVTGIVSAVYGVDPGAVWPVEALRALKAQVEAAGLSLAVVESLPVHEDVKLGRRTRDRWIDGYIESLHHIAQAGISVVCYNFMPVLDWMRTAVDYPLPDGSWALAFDGQAIERLDAGSGPPVLPGWDPSYAPKDLGALWQAARELGPEDLWAHLTYFLQAVGPEAERLGVRLALHPDDPPWPLLGLPRIITDEAALDRVLGIYDRPANGLCVCVGSLGASAGNDVVAILSRFAREGRVHFAHLRNIRRRGPRSFYETGHAEGDLDLPAAVAALHDAGYDGPVRPDHGRRIWGEMGAPGYGLYDRALGAMYLHGLWAGVSQRRRPSG